MPVRALVTDLDGTLIPLTGNAQNRRDLESLRDLLHHQGVSLVFATGRHEESVHQAILEFDLPPPDAVICDVGTTVLRREESGRLERVESWHDALQEHVRMLPIDRLQESLSDINGLRLQEPEKQGRFKLSFYTEAGQLAAISEIVNSRLKQSVAPWSLISSVDPFTNDGLMDVLPLEISKASAVEWWTIEQCLTKAEIVYAGDSGNDLAALTAGFLAVTVGNASDSVVDATRQAHATMGTADLFHASRLPATSGVLDGLHTFLQRR